MLNDDEMAEVLGTCRACNVEVLREELNRYGICDHCSPPVDKAAEPEPGEDFDEEC